MLTVQFPDAMRRVLQHAICYFGSLIDPWHMVLPEKHFLQCFVASCHTRKAYDESGIVRIDETQFFDDEDEDEDEDEEDGEQSERRRTTRRATTTATTRQRRRRRDDDGPRPWTRT